MMLTETRSLLASLFSKLTTSHTAKAAAHISYCHDLGETTIRLVNKHRWDNNYARNVVYQSHSKQLSATATTVAYIFTVDAAAITENRQRGRGQLTELRDWVIEVSIIASRALGISALL